jgi:RNA polymerase sigma-70 factor (ECF subfamily)
MRGHDFEEAFIALPECYRPAAQMILLDGTTYEDAANLLGCKVGTVKSRVNRARAHLRPAWETPFTPLLGSSVQEHVYR